MSTSLSRITARNPTRGVVPACVGALEGGRSRSYRVPHAEAQCVPSIPSVWCFSAQMRAQVAPGLLRAGPFPFWPPTSRRSHAEGDERGGRRERRANDRRGGTTAAASSRHVHERGGGGEHLRQGGQRRHPAQPRAISARLPEHHA